jgi:hypothetical protein
MSVYLQLLKFTLSSFLTEFFQRTIVSERLWPLAEHCFDQFWPGTVKVAHDYKKTQLSYNGILGDTP